MNKCFNCNNIVPNDANICPFCGVDLRSRGFQQPQTQQFQQPQFQQPQFQQPQTQQPPFQQSNIPPYQDPTFQQFPSYQQSNYQQPVYSQPTYPQSPSVKAIDEKSSNNLAKILGISSIACGVIACPANILAICGIILSIAALVLGIVGFINSKDQNDRIINGIGIGIGGLMLIISCINSILGIFLFLGGGGE